jgi:hypothetical protein
MDQEELDRYDESLGQVGLPVGEALADADRDGDGDRDRDGDGDADGDGDGDGDRDRDGDCDGDCDGDRERDREGGAADGLGAAGSLASVTLIVEPLSTVSLAPGSWSTTVPAGTSSRSSSVNSTLRFLAAASVSTSALVSPSQSGTSTSPAA